MWIFLNDRFVHREEARVSVFDRGFLYGDGVYETLRAYGGRVFMLHQHLERLRRSSEGIALPLPWSEQEWVDMIRTLLERNRLRLEASGGDPAGPPVPDAYVRITVSRGEGEIGLDPALCAHPTIVAVATPLVPPPQAWYREGVGLVLVRVRRNTAAALSPRIKSLNMLNNILAKQEAHRAGAFDGVMLNTAGHLTECSTSNLFFVRRGRLCTPAPECGLLEGITREVVLTLAREMGWPLDLGAFGPDDLLAADECFLTNTSLEVLPVQCIDGKPVGSGRPGPVTTRLKAAFRANLERFLHLS